MNQEEVVLCGASSYTKKYYFNQAFSSLPQGIQDELHIMCVLFTADVGGALQIVFDEDGHLQMRTQTEEDDILYDEIGKLEVLSIIFGGYEYETQKTQFFQTLKIQNEIEKKKDNEKKKEDKIKNDEKEQKEPIKMKENNILSFNFRVPGELKDEIEEY